MKRTSIIALVIWFLGGCYSSSKLVRIQDENLIAIAHDEEEYELIILDPGFEIWFAASWSPAKDRNQAYYSSRNQMYVTEWNYKASQPHTADFYQSQIQYDPSVNYGIEVERKFYYYFRWAETKLGILF